LIDELRTLTFPVLLGKGKKLFEAGVPPLAFKLTHSKVTPNGIVIARYERAGLTQPGDIAMIVEPNALELKRRERMKREG
jgi:hypothetical protein